MLPSHFLFYFYFQISKLIPLSGGRGERGGKEREREIVGFVVWKEGGEGKIGAEDFKPVFLESAKVEMLGYFIGKGVEHRRGLEVEGLAGELILLLSMLFQFQCLFSSCCHFCILSSDFWLLSKDLCGYELIDNCCRT